MALALALALAFSAAAVEISPAADAAQAGMVEIGAVAPDIALDMRYAGSDNFTGRPVPGYGVARCYLLTPVAQALARVQQALRAQGYSLQVFDCYRPAHAVRAFVAWAADLDDQSTKARYYPNVDKRELLGSYIAETSGHSRGATVDLGVLDCRSAPCVALDMGTGFDYFDPRAHTAHAGLEPAQRRHRQLLLDAMAEQGFSNYSLEWWHFSWQAASDSTTAYDFPLR
ncbi:M15 family metallopeptidase [Stenotrophomonas sp. YIM B06876]|uniref:M15 family metallopeptidase n=1 Tax=Stenotrophomonas sp. YIM B06876 TaxID=3060211 RepID=UPI00273A0FDE|nr:M15 family metallopeptidase [Stenotrophomonas sp. YIM B06876]